MAKKTGPLTKQGFRSKRRALTHRPTPVALPTQRTAESDAYTWAVNAAVESGQTELAYEIAAGYQG